ncbi:MAG TPA: Rne/Rng family ribonuclease [Verrucomicrobiae bacterium]|nr:Rne/Rng family ribonuclease [Verrucomicrobiae bacterium]
MAKKMLINALHEEEARVAIVEDGKLTELDIEIAGKEETRGNVYKGTVVRVEPGLQAAFVDIGAKKLGFLQMGEIHPDCWRWRDDVAEEQKHRRPRIQEILRRGQEIVVQVEKGERDTKGAALTTYLSLPGRYMVLMPGSDSAGVSRKVEAEGERKKLKEKAAQLEIPDGIGYIMRTEAQGRTKTELNRDLQSLVKLHEEILKRAGEVKAPALIYQESSVVIRTIRDYFNADIEEILVDNKEVYKETRAFLKRTMPKYEKVVKLHQEKRPIFSRYQIEEQIDLIYEKKVPLKSGGSIVIEPTEALVSIDVNSGKSTGEKGVEETAFRSNVEAAEEVARQLRLRDLGGLIVIDFIDMRDRKHIAEVEKTLKNALKTDKARVTVGKISQFGILEMSRQRIRQTIVEAIHLHCPHCEGRGKIKSVEAMALSFLRKVHAAAAKGSGYEVRGGLPLEVAYYLLNRKKRELAQIEDEYDIDVTVKGKPSFLMNQIELEVVKRERAPEPKQEPVMFEEPAILEDEAEEEETETGEPAIPAEEGENGDKKRKKRRRKKKKDEGELAAVAAEGAPEAEAEVSAEEEGEPRAGEEAAQPAKRKRKRRRRGKGGAAAEGGVEESAVPATEEEAVEPSAEEEQETAEAGTEGQPEEGKKRKRKRRRRKKPAAGEAAATAEGGEEAEEAEALPQESAEQEAPAAAQPEAEAEAVLETPEEAAPEAELPQEAAVEAPAEPQPAAAPKRSRTRRKPAGKAEPEAEAAAPQPEPEAAPAEAPEEKPARKRAPRKRAAAPQEEATAAPEAPPAAAEEKPKTPRKRAPRKKPQEPKE